MILRTVILLGILLSFFSCEDNKVDDNMSPEEDENLSEVLIDEELYQNVSASKVDSAYIINDTLHLIFSNSGCSGDSWVFYVVDAGLIMESYPPQRSLKFVLENSEQCEAYITRETKIDLKPIKDETFPVVLHLDGWNKSLMYE
ncbi:hypothetical protein [Flammeovirga agarivorans]|uniref:Uncharacterized protein n=1 Tax=Flammeovirga agarivorans TaxID=2726742 RepID=A0A7X8XY43_9BACT|nr:hypothetical protein [Flammeovirga agarivorans]NLR93695.1 hypothetical protein [Flammeovirga agarivorans]